jgi:integrase
MGGERKYEGVRIASSSSIEIDFYYSDTRCKERLKLEPTPANLKRASQHRAAILATIDRGEFDYGATFPTSKNAAKFHKKPEAFGLTLTMYLDTWLEEKRKRLKASTWDGYRKCVNHLLIPNLGHIRLEALKRSDVKDFIKKIPCSNKRLSNILSILRSALEDAVHEDEVLDINPIVDWTYQNAEVPKAGSDVNPFTAQEQAAILEQCHGQFQNLVRFALWTGLRTSELIALDWGDIDWERGVIKVTRAMTAESKVPEVTKTAAGKRDVKILGPALAALKAQKQFTFLAGAEIFQDPRLMTRWSGDQAIRKGYWTPALARAGVTYRRPYQTRHTFASMMLSAGEHPMWVAQQMGHSDWGMIRRVYGKFLADSAPEAGGMAVLMFGNADRNVDQNVDQTTPSSPIKWTKPT